jgi:tetratricopeptide (TPR) repeat protein
VSELEFRRAELRASHLGDVAGALDLLQQIVKSAPNHEGARRLLEKLVALPEHRQRVAAILEPVYQASGAWARLVAILEVQREPLVGRPAAAMLARIADLQENRLQAKPAALATWRQLLAVEPDSADALAEIERLGMALERFSELVDVYQELAFKRDAADIEGRADLFSRAAKLYAGRLGNRRAAIDVWKLVLNLDPNATEIAVPAAAALETLYADTGDVAGLVKILRLQVRWAGSAAERKKILFRIAGLEEKSLNDVDAAVATLRAVLELDPQEREAIDALDRIFEAGSNHRQRVEILRKRIDMAGDAASRQDLWRRVASLLERDVGDVDEAIAACVSILDENPSGRSGAGDAGAPVRAAGAPPQRLEILERRLALAPARSPERIGLLRQIACCSKGPLGDPARRWGAGARCWRRRRRTASAAALERFLAPGTDGGLRLAAAQALEPIYEAAAASPSWRRWCASTSRRSRRRARRLEQLMRLARWRRRARRQRGARATTALAIRDALAEPELATLLDSYERLTGLERWQRGGGALPRDQPRRAGRGGQAAPGRTIAEVAPARRRRRDWPPTTTAGAGPHPRGRGRAGGAGADLRQRRREALYEILVRRAELAARHGRSASCGCRSARWPEARWAARRGDRGVRARARRSRTTDRDAAQALDRLYTKAERWGDLTRLLEDCCSAVRCPSAIWSASASGWRRSSTIASGDREAALEHLRLVLAGDPDHPARSRCWRDARATSPVQGAAAELLEPVYAARADWPALIKIGEIRLLQTEEPAQRLAWTKRIARLYEEQLEDYDSALRWYGRVFQEAPTERLSLEQLVRLADKLNRWQDLASLLSNTSRASWARSRRCSTSCAAPRRSSTTAWASGPRPRSTTAACSTRGPTIATSRSCSRRRWSAGALAGAARADRRGAGRAVDPAAKLALLRRSAKLDEEKLDSRGARDRTLREAMDVDPPTAAPRRSWNGCWRRGAVARAGRSPVGDAWTASATARGDAVRLRLRGSI